VAADPQAWGKANAEALGAFVPSSQHMKAV